MDQEKVIPDAKTVRTYAAMNLLLNRYGKDKVEGVGIEGVEESGHLKARIDGMWQTVRVDLQELAAEEEKLRNSEWEK